MKTVVLIAIAVSSIAVVVGCGSGSSPAADDAALRKQLSKTHVDINDVPPSQRKMVQGFIDRANEMRAKAGAHAAGQ